MSKDFQLCQTEITRSFSHFCSPFLLDFFSSPAWRKSELSKFVACRYLKKILKVVKIEFLVCRSEGVGVEQKLFPDSRPL